MASLIRSEARTLARYIAQDEGTNPAVSDTEVNTYLEEARQWYGSTFPEDVMLQAGVITFTLASPEATLTTSTAVFRDLSYAYNATTGEPMEKTDNVLLSEKLMLNAVTAQDTGNAKVWGCMRVNDTDWTVFTYPQLTVPSNNVVIWGHAELEPMTLDANPVRFGNHGSRVIARLAALEMARAAGRPDDFLADIASQLPERVVTRRQDIARLLGPKPMRT